MNLKTKNIYRNIAVVLIVSMILCIFSCATVRAEGNVITERLYLLMNSSEEKLIPVRIEFEDKFDFEQMENQAMEKANLTSAEKLIIDQYEHTLTNSSNALDYMSIEDFNKTIAINGTIKNKNLYALAYKFDTYCYERINLMREYYDEYNKNLLQQISHSDSSVEKSKLMPVIYRIMLTREQIISTSKLPNVICLDIAEIKQPENMIANSDRITRSNTVRANGYSGSGIKIGVVELGYPNTSALTNSSNVVRVEYQSGDPTNTHSVAVINTIQQIAPSATIYIKPNISRFAQSTVSIVEDLIVDYGVHVVNLSIGICTNDGGYQQESRDFDTLVRRTNRTIVTSAGNSSGYINDIAAAPNVIAVGSVNSHDRTVASTTSYTLSDFSSYLETSSGVNKPDICAPGENLSINNSGTVSGTSFSSPTVAAIIALMLNRNIWMMDKPQIIKSAIMVSARYHGNSSYSSNVSDREGAGVVDALTCYDIAKNGRRNHYDFNSSSPSTVSFDVYADNTTSPFRVAIAWNAQTINSSTLFSDYDLYLYKGDTLVASSRSIKNNYEIVELTTNQLSTHGAGYYRVEIKRFGTVQTDLDRVGLTWEQY